MLATFRAAENLADIAKILGYKPSALSYILYRSPRQTLYAEFELPKKGGGRRKIKAPNPSLKGLQRRLADVLSQIYEELHPNVGARTISHGFVKKLSIQTNAAKHTRKRHVLNVDIAAFFPSFNFGRVRGFFIKNRNFRMAPAAATILAQIACHNNELPQGSPSSPVISNLITHGLDAAIVRLAQDTGCSYSRYADDLTFSTNQKNFPAEVAMWDGRVWLPSARLLDTVRRHGFVLNPDKTRMSSRTGRQSVTGLVVNRHVNVRRSYYKQTRAMTHSLFTKGSYSEPEGGVYPKDRRRRSMPRLRNWLNLHAPRLLPILASTQSLLRFLRRWRFRWWQRLVSNVNVAPPQVVGVATPNLHVLQGRLAFIHNVKVTSGREVRQNKAIRELYKSFLIYRYFYAPERPILLFEGKTDYVYIRTALRRLATSFPELIGASGARHTFKVSFFPRRSKTADVLDMSSEGEGTLKVLIAKYASYMSKFSAPGQKHPVIVVVDNDTGGESIYKLLRGFGKNLNVQTGPGITHVTHNLYLLATDPLGSTGQSCIEQLFTPATLAIELEGRKFKFDGETIKGQHYGKAEFANRVVLAMQNSIDFSGFAPLLGRISDVIVQHRARIATTTPPASPPPTVVTPAQTTPA